MANGTEDGPVLFAYDGSEQAMASIREAVRQLGPDRHVIVLTVSPPAGRSGSEKEADEVAHDGATLARSVGFDARPLAERGDPIWRSIVDVADANEASLVVIGSQGGNGSGTPTAGDVAAAVAQHTQRPVMIVHAPAGWRAA
jgi:nucleotide-binding universal stress UspA family protein